MDNASRRPSSYAIGDLPHNLDAEAALIACCLIDADSPDNTIDRARAAGITRAHFYSPANGLIFDAIVRLQRESPPATVDLLAADLRERGDLERVGGVAYIANLGAASPTTAHARRYVTQVCEYHARREITKAAQRAIEQVARPDSDLADALEGLRDLATGSTGTAAQRPYTIWAPSQFIDFTPDPSAMLLGDGYVEKGEWTSLVGIGGLGKTRLALWLCIAVITSRKWCDLPTKGGPIKCLVLSTESGLRRWKTDLEAIYRSLTTEERNLVESHLRLLALTPEEEGDLNLGDPANVARLTATLRAFSPGLVVFDPFADMIDGDENLTVDLVRTLRTLRGIHRSGAPESAAVIIHHARTGANNVAQAGDNFSAGNFARGAKALYSRVRCELQLAPGDRDNPNLIVLACGKANNAEKFKPRGIVFDPESFTYSVDTTFDVDAWRSDVAGKRTSKTVTIADVVDSARELCPTQGDTTPTKALCDHVIETTGAGLRTIKDRIREAVDEGYLRKPRHGVYGLGPKPLKK